MDAVYGSTIAAPVSFCAGHMPSWTRHPRRIGHYVPHASFRRSDRRPLDTRLRPCGTRSGVTLGLRVTIEPPRAPSVDTTTAHTLCASSERPRHATSSRRASRRHRAAHRAPLPTMRSCHASDYSTRAASHQLLQRTRYAPPPTPAPRHIEPPRLHRLRRPSHDSAAPKRTATPMIASCPSLGTPPFYYSACRILYATCASPTTRSCHASYHARAASHHFTTTHSAPHGTRTRVTTPSLHIIITSS